jgi:hypothetical protein
MPNLSIPSPPRQAIRRRRTKELQPKKRITIARLLKKASLDPPCSPNFHLESLTQSFTSERPAPRESTKTTSLQ